MPVGELLKLLDHGAEDLQQAEHLHQILDLGLLGLAVREFLLVIELLLLPVQENDGFVAQLLQDSLDILDEGNQVLTIDG